MCQYCTESFEGLKQSQVNIYAVHDLPELFEDLIMKAKNLNDSPLVESYIKIQTIYNNLLNEYGRVSFIQKEKLKLKLVEISNQHISNE